MGRRSTGAATVGSCLQVHAIAFVKEIKKGSHNITGSIKWDSGTDIRVKLSLHNGSYIMTLEYTKTDKNGTKHPINYQVLLVTVLSNLGKGEVYYFLCPFSGKRCKTLYMGYGSLCFKSRETYRHRIYYASN